MQLITEVLQPMVPVPGVTPVGELEVRAALADPEFLVVDMREPEWRVKATIPGSISIPFSEVMQRLEELGCSRDATGWVCTVAGVLHGSGGFGTSSVFSDGSDGRCPTNLTMPGGTNLERRNIG